MEQQYRVQGLRRYNDAVDGKHYDFTKVRIEMKVPRNAVNECGANTVEAQIGTSALYEELSKIPFPCLCIVDLEMTSRGFEVLGLRPVETKAVSKVA